MRAWLVAVVVCACSDHGRLRAVRAPDAGRGDVGVSAPVIAAPDGGGVCQARACGEIEPLCPAGERCVAALCRPDQGACFDDGDCHDDTRCRNRACVAFGETCTREPAFAPACTPPQPLAPPRVLCNWTGAETMSTPLVADLDRDGDAEVVLPVVRGHFGASGDRVVALDARSCQPIWDVPAPVWSELAIADLDADGKAEIVFASSPPIARKEMDDAETITVLDHLGQVRASLRQQRPALRWQAAPLVVDLDGTSPPEIVYRRTALRFRVGRLEVVWRAEPRAPADRWISVPVAADLDGDGLPEIIDGTQVLDGASGRDETPPEFLPAKIFPGATEYAIAHVADFNRDGGPDVLHVSPQGVSIYDVRARRQLFHTRLPEEDPGRAPIGGPAVVADLDGDGASDFAFATRLSFIAYAMKCVPSDRPGDCHGDPGVLWAKTIQDPSSGIATPSAFDFNADGVVELVYRDENWLRILAGPTGRTLFRLPVSSGTALEGPVIADATGDGHADILVASDLPPPPPLYRQPSEPETGVRPTPTRGLFVLGSESWAPARPLWNQHAYAVSNVNDDLTVPTRVPFSSALGLRQQALPAPANQVGPAPDLTGRIEAPACLRADRWLLRGRICNRGPVAIAAGVQATFYVGAPDAGGGPLCTTAPAAALEPGHCQETSCTVAAPAASVHLHLRVGDDGRGGRTKPQCTLGNDLASRPVATCVREAE